MKMKLFALSLLAFAASSVLLGCATDSSDKSAGESAGSSSVTSLKEPTVTFNLAEGQKIDYGSSYDAGFTVTPNTIEYEWSFKSGETDLEHSKPTEIGQYKLEVVTEANDEYKSVTKSVNFEIVAGAVKVTPTLTILVNGEATENGLSYPTDSLPTFSYNCSEATATVEAWYSKDDGETNLGSTAPTEVGVYAYNVKVVGDDNFNEVSAFIWYNITAPKQDVASMTLTFNGVEYTKNDWTEKLFVIGETQPTWSVVTDPTDAASHVEFWITLNEVEVDGWPTVAGDYVFCCGIKSSDTAYNKKFIYVGFTMVAQLPQEKTPVAITMTIGGKALTGNDWSTQEILVNTSFEDAIQFTTDPAEAVSAVTYKIVVEETEAVVQWNDINSVVDGTIYKITWTIDKNSNDYKDASANSYGAGTLFMFKNAVVTKTPATITCTINGTPIVGSDWANVYQIPVNSNFEDVIVFSTDPAEALSAVQYRIEVGDTEVPTTWDDIKATAGEQEYKLVWLIDPTSDVYERDPDTSAGWGAGTHFVIKDSTAPVGKTKATITCTINGTPITGSDWNNVHEIPVNSNFEDVIVFSTDPAAALSAVQYRIEVGKTEVTTTWDDIKATAGEQVYKLIWLIDSTSELYERDPDTSAGWGAGTKFVIKGSTAPVGKTKATITCTINGTPITGSDWAHTHEIPVNSNFEDVIVFSTNPAEALSAVQYRIEVGDTEASTTWDAIKATAGETVYKLVWLIDSTSELYERDPDTSATWGAATYFIIKGSTAPVGKTKATITCTINGTPLTGSDWNNVYQIPVNSNFEDVIVFSTNPTEALSAVQYRIEVGETEVTTTWDDIKATAGEQEYKIVWLINPTSELYERDPDTSATWGAGTKFVITNPVE